MTKEYHPDMPWAIVELNRRLFAVAAQDLREMVVMPEIAMIPQAPPYARGVINLRGQVMPLIDLRIRMGMTSAVEESESFCRLMNQRASDHQNWLQELEDSVRERREFKLTTDPHQCAFGRWYDSYRAENPWIAGLLKKFDDPHQRIHQVGLEVQQLAARSQYDQASDLIDANRARVLSVMLKLFGELAALIRETRRETAIVLTASGKTFAASVDAAVAVEKLVPASVGELPPGTSVAVGGVVRTFGRRAKNDEIVLIIDTQRLMTPELNECCA